MEKAPVYFTIVQARFNAILALDDYVPKVQERFRRTGFPDFQKNEIATFNLNMGQGDSRLPQVPVAQETRYTFSNAEKTSGFLLNQNSLSYQTTEYDTFEIFSDGFLAGLGIVHDIVELSYTDRLGVRYLDAISPDGDKPVTRYLTDSVTGLYDRLPGTTLHSFTETAIRGTDATLIARTILANGPLGVPPDLLPMWLLIGERFRNINGPHAVLDTDGSTDGREPFDLEAIATRLKTIHSAVTSAFKKTVTEYALAEWK